MAMMRESRDDSEIRTRIEDYFREGDIAPVIERLLESAQVDIAAWLGTLDALNIDDAGELRGTTAAVPRITSRPPRSTRWTSLCGIALAEGAEFEESLGRAFQVAEAEYSVGGRTETGALAGWFVEHCIRHNPAWAPTVWRLDEHYLSSMALTSHESEVLAAPGRPGESIMVLDRQLTRIDNLVSEIAELWR